MSAEATIVEAERLSRLLFQDEYQRLGGVEGAGKSRTDLAIASVSAKFGIEESALRSLRYRWRRSEIHSGSRAGEPPGGL